LELKNERLYFYWSVVIPRHYVYRKKYGTMSYIEDDREELLELSREIVLLIDEHEGMTLTEEGKEGLENALDSMNFHTSKGNLKRALSEGKLVLKKLKNSLF